MQNFEGYDIDPGMVRIAQVNMYLHQFKNPKIVQYDSLSMDERWNDKFDVILANPPFMSPKGGVSTHNKFGIQSTRSEVLFVDYIMNHLRPKGRAGIIVPEGIIFQSATAYKQLRKNLVNNGLYAVVSLPSGVFQPYSGVKTSILFFDNEIAKKDDDVLFIKINNDGFDLGAQRRPLKTSHLPAALEILHLYREHVLGGKKIVFKSDDEFALLVSKEKITKSDDYSLSGDRYRTNTDYENIKWPLIEIGELCELGRGRVISKRDIENDPGPYPVYSSQTTDNGIFGYINTFDFDGEYVTWTTDGANAGTVFHRNGKFNCTNVCGTLKAKTKDVDMRFLAKVLNNVAYKYVIQVGNPKLMNNVMAKIKIPVPPLEVQKEIVEQIEIKQRAIEGAREVIKNLERERRYFAHSLRGLKDIKWLKLGDVCETSSGGTPLKSKKEYYENGTVPWLKSGEVNQGYVYKTEEKITPIGLKNSSAKIFPVDTVLVAMYGATAGKVGLLKTEASTNQAVCGILPNDKIVPEFLYFYLRTRTDDMVRLSGGGAQPNISQAIIRNMEIPLIPIDTQKILIADVVREEEVINSNKKLIEIMENKISNVLVGL
jgi:type I restriction enzyme M protein